MATIFKRGSAALLFALMALLPMLFLSSQIASANNSRLFAVMDYNGNFVRGSNVVSTTHLGTGRFEITFNRNVSTCAYTAAIGDPANGLVYNPGLVFTAGGHANGGGPDPYGVYVETKNLGGGLSDYPFHLNVSCNGPFAVMDYNGNFVRGAGVVSTTHLGPGRYEITFNRKLNTCAYTATIGDPANGLVYNPGLVFTAGGHNNNGGPDPYGVYVETKNLGGGLGDWPFHLNVNCLTKIPSNFAVMDYNGNFVRGSNVASTTHLGPGQYEITFKQNVSQCAYIATIGDPAHGLVYNPGLVFTAGGHANGGGPDPYGVYVETKNLGGGLGDWPFHLNVTC